MFLICFVHLKKLKVQEEENKKGQTENGKTLPIVLRIV